MQQEFKIIGVVILSVLLAACGTVAPATVIVPTLATFVPSQMPVGPSPSISPSPSAPPYTLTPASVLPGSILTTPPPTWTPVPIASLPLSSAPKGLHMAYIVDGNLYVQNASDAPIKLTQGQDDVMPRFSEDGERILFYRNPEPFTYHSLDLYSIHADGTQEKMLVTGSLLEPLGLGYNKSTTIADLSYVPGTHQILFHTCQPTEEIFDCDSHLNLDLLLVDMDTGKIKTLLPPGKGGNFVVSPDGSMVAIQASGHIDVVSIDGQMIRKDLVTYTPSKPYELLPDMFWTKDSTELLVALPVDTVYKLIRWECTTDVGARSLWRYAINDNTAIQIPLNPPPLGHGDDEYSISPDRNWISYSYSQHPYECQAIKTDASITPGRYLGNLQQGTIQWYSSNIDPLWSPDSKHFLYDLYEQGMFLGSVDGPPVPIDNRIYSVGWLDSTHYFAYYMVDRSAAGTTVGIVGEVKGKAIYFPVSVPASILGDTGRDFRFDFIYLDY